MICKIHAVINNDGGCLNRWFGQPLVCWKSGFRLFGNVAEELVELCCIHVAGLLLDATVGHHYEHGGDGADAIFLGQGFALIHIG